MFAQPSITQLLKTCSALLKLWQLPILAIFSRIPSSERSARFLRGRQQYRPGSSFLHESDTPPDAATWRSVQCASTNLPPAPEKAVPRETPTGDQNPDTHQNS